MDIFDNSFDKVLKDANDKYQSKKSTYGESWKDMHRNELSVRFNQEFSEWYESEKNSKEEYNEIIDMINVLLMMGTQLDKELN